MRQKIKQLLKNGELQEARRLGEALVAGDNADSDDYAVVTDVYLAIARQCLATGVLSYMKGLTDRIAELLPEINDDGSAERAYKSLLKSQLPHGTDIAAIEAISRTKGREAEAMEMLTPLLEGNALHQMLHDDAGMIIYRYLRAYGDSLDPIETRRRLRDYIQLDNERPSALHSLMLALAVKLARKTPDFNFYRFFMMWHPRNLRPADLCATETDGRRQRSLLARAIDVIIDSDHVSELPVLLRLVRLPARSIMEVVREACFTRLLNSYRQGDSDMTVDMLDLYAGLGSLHAPSQWHSGILDIAVSTLTDSRLDRFPAFLIDWDPDFLRADDWLPTEHNHLPLAVRALQRCFSAVKRDVPHFRQFIPRIIELFETAIPRVSDNHWLKRKHALMLSWIDCNDEAVNAFRQLASEAADDFYFWRDFSEAVEDRQLKTSLLSRALMLTDNSTGQLACRLTMAQLLHFMNLDERAAVELDIYRRYMEEEGKKLPARYHAILETLNGTQPGFLDNGSFYRTMSRDADAFIFINVPTIAMSVIGIMPDGDSSAVALTDGHTTIKVNMTDFPADLTIALGCNFDVKFASVHEHTSSRTRLLHVAPADGERYGNLPQMTGYVDSLTDVGNAKVCCGNRTAHVTADNSDGMLKEGMFVKFRYYTVDGERRGVAAQPVPAPDGRRHFPVATAAIYSIDSNGNAMFTISPEGGNGIIPASMTPDDIAVGDIVDMIYYTRLSDGKSIETVPLTCSHSQSTECESVKRVSGVLRLLPDGNSASVRNVSVDPALIASAGVSPDMYVSAMAVFVPDNGVVASHWHAFSLSPYK